MSIVPLETLDNINEQLENIIDLLDGYQDELQKLVDQDSEIAQQKINELMEKIGDRISEKLKPVRDKAESALKPPLEKAKVIVEPIKQILDLLPINPDLSAIVEVLTIALDIITKPYQPLIDLITQIPPKVAQLNDNIQTIANYQIRVDTSKSHLTVPPLDIDIEPIDIS